MVFTEIIRNYGNGYDNNTGIFQAQFPDRIFLQYIYVRVRTSTYPIA